MDYNTSGSSQATIKESNLSLVIKTIHGHGVCSRAQLARETGLGQSSITKIVNILIEWGMVQEVGIMPDALSSDAGAGRKPTGITLVCQKYTFMAMRINRNYIKAAIYDIAGKCYCQQEKIISASQGAQFAAEELNRLGEELLSSCTCNRPMAIGVALPGPFDARHGRITLMSGFPGWESIDLKNMLENCFSLPVFLEHDATCGALAEWWFGRYNRRENMLFIAADRGIGAGIIANGNVYRGQLGSAGEIGHMSIHFNGPRCECGNRGCLELYASTKTLVEIYEQAVFESGINSPLPPPVTAELIYEAVRSRDSVACNCYSKIVRFLAFGLVGIINTLNPDTVVFGDHIIDGGDLFLQVIRETLQKHLLKEVYDNLTLCTSSFPDPMLFGASALAFDKLLMQPSDNFRNTELDTNIATQT